MKAWRLSLCMILTVLFLSGCGATEQAAAPEPTPVPSEEPRLMLGTVEVDRNCTELDLSDGAIPISALLEQSGALPRLERIELGELLPPYEEVLALQKAFPACEISLRLQLFGEALDPDAESLALGEMAPEETDELCAVLPYLTKLRELDFTRPDGGCVYSLEELPLLEKLRAAVPEVHLKLSFELFGQSVSSEDERIEYVCVPIGNEGLPTLRAVLPYLSRCAYLLLDGCDIDYELLAGLRDDFPAVKIVWRVWLTEKPYYNNESIKRRAGILTDATRIRTTIATDSNCWMLRYCTEVKYVDFGHSEYISDFSFLAYMPKLEACIIALTDVSDITALASCPELEYLEVYGTKVSDLSPLAACTKLKHLNCSRLPELTDISCLFGLELDRLRCVDTGVSKDQLREYAQLHPDCEMLLEGWAPHLNGWRYDENDEMVPRYKLLREQMEYDIDFSYGIP